MSAKTKICTRCRKRRQIHNFHKDSHMRDGVSSWCKACSAEYAREYAKRKREKVSA